MRKLLREHQKVRYILPRTSVLRGRTICQLRCHRPTGVAVYYCYDVQATTCDKQCRLEKQKYFCNTESRAPRATPIPESTRQSADEKEHRKHGQEDPAAFLVLLPSLRAAENPASAPHLQEGVDLHVGGR